MLVNSYSSPRAKGCTGKFQNFVRLGNCSRIDHNKSQAEESGSHAHRISAEAKRAKVSRENAVAASRAAMGISGKQPRPGLLPGVTDSSDQSDSSD